MAVRQLERNAVFLLLCGADSDKIITFAHERVARRCHRFVTSWVKQSIRYYSRSAKSVGNFHGYNVTRIICDRVSVDIWMPLTSLLRNNYVVIKTDSQIHPVIVSKDCLQRE